MKSNYSAIYYPNSYVQDPRSLMTYLFIYDEIHFITPAMDSRNPTEYFKNLPDYTKISSITRNGQRNFLVTRDEVKSNQSGELDEKSKQVVQFYQFIQRYKDFIGESIYFHPNMIASLFSRLTEKVTGEGLPVSDLMQLFLRQDPAIIEFDKFQKEFPEVKNETLWATVPTALNLAKEKDLILVSDTSEIPVPLLSNKVRNVKLLTSILAEECVKITIPDCRSANPEEILEIREKLQDTLVPFRMSLQKLSGDLRNSLEEDMAIEDIKGEAKFIVESQIQPAVYELQKSIEKSNSKLLNNVFGKALSWLPFVAKAYTMPTPENLLAVAKKMGTDSNSVFDALDDLSYTKAQGLSFLLQVEQATTKK
ncbi:hypothetical protein [Vibrio vulnificus]|uniref:hypothetical protein n=2 Tax=Vibrio TaxID=662 RepID=UPI000DAE2F06|nr:hypothetical protein [Vibrio vulnificus]MDK2622450.1 hypothetical protein [Vibrio vulnificus]RAH18645.1 hypothetical protein DOT36_19685 [Vibrio vulnificus]